MRDKLIHGSNYCLFLLVNGKLPKLMVNNVYSVVLKISVYFKVLLDNLKKSDNIKTLTLQIIIFKSLIRILRSTYSNE